MYRGATNDRASVPQTQGVSSHLLGSKLDVMYLGFLNFALIIEALVVLTRP